MPAEIPHTEEVSAATQALRTDLFALLVVSDWYLGAPGEDVIHKRSVGGPAVYRFAAVRHARQAILDSDGSEPTPAELEVHLGEEFMQAKADYFIEICKLDAQRLFHLPSNPFNQEAIQEALEKDPFLQLT